MYDPLQVSLPWFDGPLDLLLHLVRKQELDIHELRLADLTEPYLAHVERMHELNLDAGGEFLAIAATLVWIKSRSLLPREALDDDEPDPGTLEEMLLLRLREYQRYKDAAAQLAARDLLGREVFPRRPAPEADEAPAGAPPFAEVSIFGLLEAFRSALERAAAVRDLHIIPERARVEDRVDAMLGRLAAGRPLYLHDFFDDAPDRAGVILTFIALLELVRLRAIHVSQAGPEAPILCAPTDAFLGGGTDFRAMLLAGILGDEAPPPDEPVPRGRGT